MSVRQKATRETAEGQPPATSARDLTAQEHRSKELMLTQHEPAAVRKTTDAVVLKRGNLLLLATDSGDLPMSRSHGYGLFYQDTRYLSGYTMAVNDQPPVVLSYVDARGYETLHDLANPLMSSYGTGARIDKNTIAMRRQRFIRAGVLYDLLDVHNYGTEPAALRIALRFRAGFEDIAVIRGFVGAPRPRLGRAPRVRNDALELSAYGADDYLRTVTFTFSPPAVEVTPGVAIFDCTLPPGADYHQQVTIAVAEWPPAGASPAPDPRKQVEGKEHTVSSRAPIPSKNALRWLERSERIWLAGATAVETSNPLFNETIRRSLLDLQMLRSRLDGLHYFAAGIPWFNTLFGRDSCIVAVQTLPFGHLVAGQTVQLLARYQATKFDAFRDAEPGKILHEYRAGELAHIAAIPQSPAYYGSVDSTLLFLILMAEYVNWSGDLDLARNLRPNLDAALGWIDKYADHDGDGYLDYVGQYAGGLINQGWKDAGNSIPNADGSQVTPPVAMCEVQAYVYRAWRQTAGLLRSLGERDRAAELERRAADMQARFERDFWSEELGCYLLALQEGGRPAAVMASNTGQVLWTGIAHPDRARRVSERLRQPDMFSGWGIRTLSSAEKAYNPISYHLGTVWPHDNALIAAGFERYGLDEAALAVFGALFDAAAGMNHYRLPELFSGYERREGEQRPVGFPVACSPQAWAAGAIPHVLWTTLGLRANAPENRLRIVRPVLPPWLDWLELQNIRVGKACLALRFERTGGPEAPGVQPATVDVISNEDGVEIEVTGEVSDPGLYT